MSGLPQESVTQLLVAAREGNKNALNDLFPLVYEELRKLAHENRQGWYGDYTLNSTALVHEAYLKLADQSQLDLNSRAHFFAVAAKAMRHILINYAEARRTKKRGGDVEKLSLEEEKAMLEDVVVMSDDQADEIVALGEALKKLEATHPRQAQIVDCKFFGRMTNKETAGVLGISEATVKRDWLIAQAWLRGKTRLEVAKWAKGTST